MKKHRDLQESAQFILNLPLKPEIRAQSMLPIPDNVKTNGECLEFILRNEKKAKRKKSMINGKDELT